MLCHQSLLKEIASLCTAVLVTEFLRLGLIYFFVLRNYVIESCAQAVHHYTVGVNLRLAMSSGRMGAVLVAKIIELFSSEVSLLVSELLGHADLILSCICLCRI